MKETLGRAKGFTLIELLVVISIIALLSSVVLSSLNSARSKAATAKVLAEKRSLQTGVQFFLSDTGYYPYPNALTYQCLAGTNCLYAGTSYAPSSAGELSSLTTNYVRTLSVNPTVTIGGQNYAGPIYQCQSVSGSRCTAARIYFTISATSCPSGSTLAGTGSNGVLCEADAGGTGSSSTY